jgi:hypothetical protein
VRTFSRASGLRMGFLAIIRSDAYFRFVFAMVSEETFLRNAALHSAEQHTGKPFDARYRFHSFHA